MSDSEFTYEMLNESADYEDGLNALNPQDPNDMAQYNRLLIQGKCVKLPNTESISEEIYQNFLTGFLSDIQNDEHERAKVFRFMWKNEDENITADGVPYGVPGDIDDMVKLIKMNRIKRSDISPLPEPPTWDKVLKLTADKWCIKEVRIKNEDDQTEKTVTPPAQGIRRVVDSIIHFISGNFYKAKAAAERCAGAAADIYFENYTKHLQIMKKAYLEGRFLPGDMIPSYNAGVYKNYKEVIAAVRRRYGRCRTQDTMTDFFRKLEAAYAMKTRHEFKIQNLRNILEKQYITEVDEFPECSDYEGDLCSQNYPEELNPMIVTLLTYILFLKEVPKRDWDKVQKQYYGLIKGRPTYKLWHENRQELWGLMDDELKIGQPKDTINEISDDPEITQQINNLDLDEEGAAEFINVIRKNRFRKNAKFSGNRFKNKQYNNNKSNNNNNNKQRFQPNWKQSAAKNNNMNTYSNHQNRGGNLTLSDKKQRMLKLLCTHCSRHAGANRYHAGPYGGGPNSACPYDSRGNMRAGFQFVASIFGTLVNALDIPDYREIENDGLEYVPCDAVNNVQIDGQALLNKAIPNYQNE